MASAAQKQLWEAALSGDAASAEVISLEKFLKK